MPLDVIMPALGMAQDTGLIVAWHKSPGDQVAEGDVLFEVETDKATMEVEAAGAGYLVDVAAEAGSEVPVGNVIARISETPEGTGTAAPAPASQANAQDDLPEGNSVIMPTLGMAQDTGLIVSWQKAPGDAVAADDVLFEVETDKSTVEVPAGFDGFFAAQLADAGEDIPVGRVIAIISAEKPATTVQRSAASATAAPTPATPAPVAEKTEKPAPAAKAAAKPAVTSQDGRILASPKLRRLAMEQGLDLSRLVKAGYPQPYHVRDLDVLRNLPNETPAVSGMAASRRITAALPEDDFAEFMLWAAEQGFKDGSLLLAALAAASLGSQRTIEVEAFGATKVFASDGSLSGTNTTEDGATLRIRDLRFSRISSVEMGGEDMPVLTLSKNANGLSVTLECSAHHLTAPEAVALISNFAGRIENPLRHLL
jgi:pyruvate dehydrogenase E2 component (dihydrolipoamide acetyltransferase)/2-oxoglutarate dehydrogenase E2 component (dihydrolipoamide succinyltransferase)